MNEHPANPEPAIPATLGEELRAAYRAGVPVPAALDRAILAAARGRVVVITSRRTRTMRIARWGSVAAAAAAIAIAAIVWPRAKPATPLEKKTDIALNMAPAAPGAPAAAASPQDINGDGVVDILDAFALARAVDDPEEDRMRAVAKRPGRGSSGTAGGGGGGRGSLNADWDFNHDGVVDRRDADDVAMRAVRLSPAGRG